MIIITCNKMLKRYHALPVVELPNLLFL